MMLLLSFFPLEIWMEEKSCCFWNGKGRPTMYVRLKSLWHNKSLIFLPFSHMAKKKKNLAFFPKLLRPRAPKRGRSWSWFFLLYFFICFNVGKRSAKVLFFSLKRALLSLASCEAVRVESRRALETREGMSCWPQVKNPRPHLWKKGESRVREWPNFWPGAGKTSCCSDDDRARKKEWNRIGRGHSCASRQAESTYARERKRGRENNPFSPIFFAQKMR